MTLNQKPLSEYAIQIIPSFINHKTIFIQTALHLQIKHC